MTTAPTIQMIWFMVRLLLLLIGLLCSISWTRLLCVSEQSPDNPDGFKLGKPYKWSAEQITVHRQSRLPSGMVAAIPLRRPVKT